MGRGQNARYSRRYGRIQCKGTFFLVGFWLDKYEKETKAIADAGFEIGNHSRNHLNMPKLNENEIKNEIEYVNDRVQELTGKNRLISVLLSGTTTTNL